MSPCVCVCQCKKFTQLATNVWAAVVYVQFKSDTSILTNTLTVACVLDDILYNIWSKFLLYQEIDEWWRRQWLRPCDAMWHHHQYMNIPNGYVIDLSSSFCIRYCHTLTYIVGFLYDPSVCFTSFPPYKYELPPKLQNINAVYLSRSTKLQH